MTDKQDEQTLFVLICLNTEEELSYVDRILYESEIKISALDYADQREKQFEAPLLAQEGEEPSNGEE